MKHQTLPVTRRDAALDYLRAFVILLVLGHHAVLAYVVFGRFNSSHYLWSSAPIVDTERWIGFDLMVLFNDAYFMPLMFLLSGLFVWPSLTRKGSLMYLRDRALRLGVPFAVAVVLIMPLAYYPSFRMTGADASFPTFWRDTLTEGPWPGGPAWFIWVLLAFDAAAAALYALLGRSPDFIQRDSSPLRRPLLFGGILAVVSAAAYLPMLFVFGPSRWFTVGPFSVQASRVLLYAVYFLAGAALGAGGMQGGIIAQQGALSRRWASWLAAGVVFFLAMVGLQAVRVGVTTPAPILWQLAYGGAFVLCGAALSLALLALALRFVTVRRPIFDRLRDSAYGIYLVHYLFVVWLQYALLASAIPVVAKALVAFAGALALSWGLVAAARRVSLVARII